MILNCIICGKEMEAKKSTKKYCCRSCENKARSLRDIKNINKLRNENGMLEKSCTICGKLFYPKTAAANQRKCCYECAPEGKQLTRSEFLNVIRKQKGSKCQRCGYDTYLGALDFHHIDPTIKEFTVGNRDFKLEECVEEIKKCVMICANCHRELHNNLWDLNEILEKEEVNRDFD